MEFYQFCPGSYQISVLFVDISNLFRKMLRTQNSSRETVMGNRETVMKKVTEFCFCKVCGKPASAFSKSYKVIMS